MARQLVRTQEDERARLSRELHDGISQVLVSIAVAGGGARAAAPGAGRRAARAGHIDRGRALDRLNNAVGEVRASAQPAPHLLDDLGLPAAWNTWAANSQPSQHGVTPWRCGCTPTATR